MFCWDPGEGRRGVEFHWRENTSLLLFLRRLQDGGLSPPGFLPYWSSRLKETAAVSNTVLVHTVTLTTWHHPHPPTTLRPWICNRVFKVDHLITPVRGWRCPAQSSSARSSRTISPQYAFLVRNDYRYKCIVTGVKPTVKRPQYI